MTEKKEPKETQAVRCRQLAAAFIGECGCTYQYWRGSWFQFVGTHYQKMEDIGITIRRFFLHHGAAVSIGDIKEIVDNVRTLRHVKGEYEAPLWIGDETKSATDTIPFQNGLLDLATKTLTAHSNKFFNLHALPYQYDPTATCLEWIKFLDSLRLEPDERELLQQYMGYCLSGMNPKFQKFLMIQGLPRAGKGTIAAVIMFIIGKMNATALSMNDLAGNFALSQMEGKRLTYIDEINLEGRSKPRILETFNRIVGMSPVKIERKGENAYSAELQTRFLLTCNEIPNFFETTGAFASRMLLIPLRLSFQGREDLGLLERLTSEIAGICNWSICGLDQLKAQNRFTIPTSSAAQTEQVRRDSSHAYAFVCDHVRVSKALDNGGLKGVEIVDSNDMYIPAADLVTRFEWWTKEEYNEAEWKYVMKELRTLIPGLGRSKSKWIGGKM